MSDTTTAAAQAGPDVAAEVAQGHGLGLGAAARRLPPSGSGRPVSPATLTRWISSGATGPGGRRVRLAAVRCGGRWLTTENALRRFLAELTSGPTDGGDKPVVEAKQRARTRQDAQERAKQELDKLGI